MSWTIDPKRFGAQAREDFAQLLSQIALRIHAELVYTTPVDTGRARSNWIATLGSPSAATRGPMPAYTVIMQAQMTFEAGRLLSFPDLYIANNVDYIARLNAGHSRQAPANFVERAVDSVV